VLAGGNSSEDDIDSESEDDYDPDNDLIRKRYAREYINLIYNIKCII
jgi:hypothetical protein